MTTCISALSTAEDSKTACDEVCRPLEAAFGEEPADLVTLFISPHHADWLGSFATKLTEQGRARHLLGTTGESIVAVDREIEHGPAMGLFAVRFPRGTHIRPVRLELVGSELHGLSALPTGAMAERSTLLLLADPFSFPTDAWLKRISEDFRGMSVVGGVASGGHKPGVNRLALEGEVYDQGAVGLLIQGPVRIRTVVSQGCRPIGRPMIVTKSDRNLVQELGRRPALQAFQEVYEQLDEHDRDLVEAGLHLGVVVNEYQQSFGRGDFLARNVIGTTEEGAIAITDQVRVGRTVQFQVHDSQSADEDLRDLLSNCGASKVRGALLFTCNGRGRRMFTEPNHDVSVLREILGPIAVAGFFAMGEIGPIGGQGFLHGFTASIALFEEP